MHPVFTCAEIPISFKTKSLSNKILQFCKGRQKVVLFTYKTNIIHVTKEANKNANNHSLFSKSNSDQYFNFIVSKVSILKGLEALTQEYQGNFFAISIGLMVS